MQMDRVQPKNRFHHVGILVEDISKAIVKFAIALGIDENKVKVEVMSYVSGKGEKEEFKFAFLPLAKGENNFIELVEPITLGPTARFLEKHGEGLIGNSKLKKKLAKIADRTGLSERACTVIRYAIEKCKEGSTSYAWRILFEEWEKQIKAVEVSYPT